MFTIITDIYKSIHAAVNKGSQCFPSLMMDVSIGALFKRFSLQFHSNLHVINTFPQLNIRAARQQNSRAVLRVKGEKKSCMFPLSLGLRS